MLNTLKKFILPLIVALIVNIGAFTQMGEFVSLSDIVIMFGILLGADALLIGLMVRDYLINKR